MTRGMFLSVEGIDGAGKSTHLDYIKDHLAQNSIEVVLTREPGGTNLGESIRNLLLNGEDIHCVTELLLMFASRQELINKVIEPSLNQGKWVLADRFVDASYAYQGGGRDLGVDRVKAIADLLEPSLTTNLTLLFDAPLEVAMKRVDGSRIKDRLERESTKFFAKVQQTYRDLALAQPNRIKIINTDQDKAQTQMQIAQHLDYLLKHKK